MGSRHVQYRGAGEGGSPSPIIWADCPITRIREDGIGYGFHEEFDDWTTPATTQVHDGWYTFFDGNTAAVRIIPVAGGALELFVSTDNEEACTAKVGTLLGAPFRIETLANTGKKLWFECRVKRSVITDARGGFFIGLADEAACADEFMADAGNDFADDDFIGFWSDETDDSTGAHVHTICQKNGAAFDTIEDTFATMVAGEYMNMGFVYDPNAPDAKHISFYKDGVRSGTYVGGTSGSATVYIDDTTNFPGDEEMSVIIGAKGAHADDFTLTIAWVRCYQLR